MSDSSKLQLKQGFVPWYSGKWIPRDETLYFLAKVYTLWQK